MPFQPFTVLNILLHITLIWFLRTFPGKFVEHDQTRTVIPMWQIKGMKLIEVKWFKRDCRAKILEVGQKSNVFWQY